MPGASNEHGLALAAGGNTSRVKESVLGKKGPAWLWYFSAISETVWISVVLKFQEPGSMKTFFPESLIPAKNRANGS